ncbi:TonB family protein [Chelativorans sp. AA-79]|uniref:energy transducer TonB n=1 Tax=Chelativorans sp. AA-79 TaxID=3028735 RepID=UPI0023F71287|nr:TonB family protein [Chelativorans sp. AA-79]WEX11284.1 TonB family protein [Chelativorans sp. AA-79]
MIPWPKIAHLRELAAAEPVEPPRPETAGAKAETPPVVLDAALPAGEAGPALPGPTEPFLPRRTRAYSIGLVLALGFSALVHAGVLSFLVERIARPGVEATAEAASVEIVLEEPPSSDAGQQRPAARSSPAAEPQASANHTPAPKDAPAKQEVTHEGPRRESTRTGEVSEKPASDRAEHAAPPSEAETAEARPSMEPAPHRPARAEAQRDRPQAEPAPEDVTDAPSDEVATVTLPVENIPVPASRPELSERKAERTERKRASAPARTREGRSAEAPAKRKQAAAAKPAESTRQPATASAGRKGGATAGEIEAYARRLNRHVRRHQNYPPEARGISGTVRLAITLDSRGRFRGAKVSGSSGHAVFDREALATAHRAQPYPRPPEGYTGGTNMVSLVFKRR